MRYYPATARELNELAEAHQAQSLAPLAAQQAASAAVFAASQRRNPQIEVLRADRVDGGQEIEYQAFDERQREKLGHYPEVVVFIPGGPVSYCGQKCREDDLLGIPGARLVR